VSTHKIQILGRYYTIKGVDDKEYVNELAEYVDGHMRAIADATGTVDTQKVSILAAMKIADELFRNRQGLDKNDSELERNIEALCEQVSMALEVRQA